MLIAHFEGQSAFMVREEAQRSGDSSRMSFLQAQKSHCIWANQSYRPDHGGTRTTVLPKCLPWYPELGRLLPAAISGEVEQLSPFPQ